MTVFNILLPIFTIIALGYIAGIKNIVPVSGAKSLNNFVFYIALPALLFKATATAPFRELFNWPFIIINLAGISVSFLLAFCLMKWLWNSDNKSAALYGMNASYGTTGYMGIPLLIALFGKQAALAATLATLLHNIPVIMIVLILCESSAHTPIKQLLKPILTSPLTISVVAGFFFSASGFSLPASLSRLADLLGDASGATALFAIGLGLTGYHFSQTISKTIHTQISVLLMLKLLFQPIIVFLLIHFVFDLQPLWAQTTLLMSALPVGAGVYVFAQKYEKLEQQTLLAIFWSILISTSTLGWIIYTFNS